MTSEQELPVSVLFDDLMRYIDHYMNYNSENEFLEVIINQEECRKKWSQAEEECARLQGQVQMSHSEIERQEKKIQDIRRQLEIKLEAVSRFEKEKTSMDIKVRSAVTLINSYLSDMRVGAETKERLSGVKALLEGAEPKKVQQQFARSPGGGLDTISEAETTDLSMTQSEDDLDVSNRTRSRRGKRSSVEVLDNFSQAHASNKKRKSGHKQTMEVNPKDQLIAQTIVSISRDGPIHAVSTLEAYGNGYGQDYKRKELQHTLETDRPSAPPMYLTATASESEPDSSGWPKSPQKSNYYNTRLSASKTHQNTQQHSPSAANFGRTLSNLQLRSHVFVQKSVFKPETCEPCGKRMKFNKTKLCCRDCKATCHPECRDRVPIPCVPSTTPGHKGKIGSIADYTPQTHPMVPALIQHCVNEVEARGLQEHDGVIGLYRVGGGVKEVKDLNERFLRGKGVPNLARYQIHDICGCIKVFLGSLAEPIVGRWFWHDFATAADLYDPVKKQTEITRIIKELPPPNQDTLAFMILHLQKVADMKEIKMPIGNLAKVFGPTIIGYSGQENQLDAATMLRDTKKQQMVMETLLGMPSEYWRGFICRPSPSVSIPYNTRSNNASTSTIGKNVFGTPTGGNNKGSVGHVGGKKIYFTDDSPSPHKVTTRQKKTYFD